MSTPNNIRFGLTLDPRPGFVARFRKGGADGIGDVIEVRVQGPATEGDANNFTVKDGDGNTYTASRSELATKPGMGVAPDKRFRKCWTRGSDGARIQFSFDPNASLRMLVEKSTHRNQASEVNLGDLLMVPVNDGSYRTLEKGDDVVQGQTRLYRIGTKADIEHDTAVPANRKDGERPARVESESDTGHFNAEIGGLEFKLHVLKNPGYNCLLVRALAMGGNDLSLVPTCGGEAYRNDCWVIKGWKVANNANYQIPDPAPAADTVAASTEETTPVAAETPPAPAAPKIGSTKKAKSASAV